MHISVTGTPGTGKTTLSVELASLINAELVDLTAYAKAKTNTLFDGHYGCSIIDLDELKNVFLKDYSPFSGNLIIDGLLSHYLPVSHVIVLRSDPRLLLERLNRRDYSMDKIKENLEAEYSGVILYDAINLHENVIEVDATQGVDTDDLIAWLEIGGKKIIEKDWSSQFTEALKDLMD